MGIKKVDLFLSQEGMKNPRSSINSWRFYSNHFTINNTSESISLYSHVEIMGILSLEIELLKWRETVIIVPLGSMFMCCSVNLQLQ